MSDLPKQLTSYLNLSAPCSAFMLKLRARPACFSSQLTDLSTGDKSTNQQTAQSQVSTSCTEMLYFSWIDGQTDCQTEQQMQVFAAKKSAPKIKFNLIKWIQSNPIPI